MQRDLGENPTTPCVMTTTNEKDKITAHRSDVAKAIAAIRTLVLSFIIVVTTTDSVVDLVTVLEWVCSFCFAEQTHSKFLHSKK